MRDATGRLWFATQKGLAVIDPAGFRLNTQPPLVEVEQLSYYVPTARSKAKQQRLPSALHEGEVRVTAPFSEPIQLPPGAYGLDFEFAALSFSAPEKVRYQYQLEGHTQDWEEQTTDRLVRFPKLPPGEYVFRVRAANNDGVWNEAGASLAFAVRPHYWETGWFRLGTMLLLVALGGASVWTWSRHRIAGALERERVAHEMRALREELAHSDRVSGLAQLASGLAHELGQPLGAILRNAEAAELLIEESPPDLAEIRAILTDIRQDDQRAAGVIQRMRTMLKRKSTERAPLSIAELVQEVVALVGHNVVQRGVQLSVEVAPELPAVWGDRVQLQQVLLNLLLNGMEGMSQQPPETRHLTIQARRCAGEIVEVSVRDSGPGVPAQNVARVFEPFFSTKAEGLGIGLAVSKSLIEAHQGELWVENRAEGGACFHFTVPVVGDKGQGARGEWQGAGDR